MAVTVPPFGVGILKRTTYMYFLKNNRFGKAAVDINYVKDYIAFSQRIGVVALEYCLYRDYPLILLAQTRI